MDRKRGRENIDAYFVKVQSIFVLINTKPSKISKDTKDTVALF